MSPSLYVAKLVFINGAVINFTFAAVPPGVEAGFLAEQGLAKARAAGHMPEYVSKVEPLAAGAFSSTQAKNH